MEGELKRFEVGLLNCDRPYPSGRTYSLPLMMEAIREYNKKHNQLYVEVLGNDTETNVDMSKVVGVIENLHVHGKEVRGTFVLLDTPEANMIKDLELKFSLLGHGTVDSQSYWVLEYEIDKVVVFSNKEDLE